MISKGQIIPGEIVAGSNSSGFFDVSIGGIFPYKNVPAAHRNDQYFPGMDCLVGFIDTDCPIIISRGFERILHTLATPFTKNIFPWQCYGRDTWNSNRSDYLFSWNIENLYAWEHSFSGSKNIVIADINSKDYLFFHNITIAQCLDEDCNVIWSKTLPTITPVGTLYASYCYLSNEYFYVVRIDYIDSSSPMHVYVDIYEYETGTYINQIATTSITSQPTTTESFTIKPTHSGEVIDGYENHHISTWFDKCFFDNSFISADENRNYHFKGIYWCNIADKIITVRRNNYHDIGGWSYFNGEYISLLNASDMSLITEVELPFSAFWEDDWESEQETVLNVIATKNESGSYIYILTRRNITEKIGEGTYYWPEYDESYPYVTTNYKSYYNLYTFNESLTLQNKIEYLTLNSDTMNVLKDGIYVKFGTNYADYSDVPIDISAIIDGTKLLCVLSSYPAGSTSVTKDMGIIDPSTGTATVVTDFNYSATITDPNNNIIVYGVYPTKGFDSLGNILFSKAMNFHSIVAGQNGIYGISNTDKIYRL